MLRLVSDENFNADITRGLLRREPNLDLVRVQDVGLHGVDDPGVLAWAAAEQRVLLTHDRATVPHHAFERVVNGQGMPGVFAIDDLAAIGRAIDDILLLTIASQEGEWEGQVLFLPFPTGSSSA